MLQCGWEREMEEVMEFLFFRGLLFAIPTSLVLWGLIGWAVFG